MYTQLCIQANTVVHHISGCTSGREALAAVMYDGWGSSRCSHGMHNGISPTVEQSICHCHSDSNCKAFQLCVVLVVLSGCPPDRPSFKYKYYNNATINQSIIHKYHADLVQHSSPTRFSNATQDHCHCLDQAVWVTNTNDERVPNHAVHICTTS